MVKLHSKARNRILCTKYVICSRKCVLESLYLQWEIVEVGNFFPQFTEINLQN